MIKRKQISSVLIVFMALLVIGLGVLNKLSPVIDISEYQSEIFDRLDKALQRKFSIDGTLALKINLKPTLVTQNLRIENPAWSKTDYFLKSEQVEIGIDILDLLLGKTTIDRLILSQAVINFEQDKSGQSNWVFGKQDMPAVPQKPGSAIRLDYAQFENVSLNYLAPNHKRKIDISDGSLRRNIRGRYRLDLISEISGNKLLVQMQSNRWFDINDFRPLKIKLDTEFGKTRFSANMDLDQIMPELKADIKLTSSMLDIDVLQQQLPAGQSKPADNQKNFFTLTESFLNRLDEVNVEMSIDKIKKAHHEIDGLSIKGKVLHNKLGRKDAYLVELGGEAKKIINKKDQRLELFGAADDSGNGRLHFSLSGKGKTSEELISDMDMKLKLSNFSGNKPHAYIIRTLDMETGNDKRILFSGKAKYRGAEIGFSGKTGKGTFARLNKDKLMQTDIKLETGKSRARLYLTISKLFSSIRKIKMHLEGTHLGEWSATIAKRLPLIADYVFDGRIELRQDGIKSRDFSFKTARSHLKGRFFYHYGKPATLNMRLSNSYLAIADLNRTPEVSQPIKPKKTTTTSDDDDEEKSEKSEMVIPATDLMSLLAPTTAVNFEAKSSTVAFKRFTVSGLDLKTRWEDKVFATQVTAGKLARGELTADIYLTVVDNEAAGKIEMHVNQLDYGSLLQEMKIGDKMQGQADVSIHLVGFGKDLKQFLTHSDGIAEFVGEKGILASKYIKLWGEDIVQQILPFNWFGSEQTQLNCVVGRFDLTDGRLSSDSLLIDTEGMTIAGTGAISLESEELAFELMPDPKNISLISLATPVKIRGTMARPRIEPHALGTTWTIGSLLAGLANPAILIARFAKLGSLGENPCLAAIGKKEGEEQETSILKAFKDAVKFIQRPLDRIPDIE